MIPHCYRQGIRMAMTTNTDMMLDMVSVLLD